MQKESFKGSPHNTVTPEHSFVASGKNCEFPLDFFWIYNNRMEVLVDNSHSEINESKNLLSEASTTVYFSNIFGLSFEQ